LNDVADNLFLLQAFNVNICEEGDPIITCAFKTELITVLLTLTRASIAVNIGPT
jgi:myosin-1